MKKNQKESLPHYFVPEPWQLQNLQAAIENTNDLRGEHTLEPHPMQARLCALLLQQYHNEYDMRVTQHHLASALEALAKASISASGKNLHDHHHGDREILLALHELLMQLQVAECLVG